MSTLKFMIVGCFLLLSTTSAGAAGFTKVGLYFGNWEGLTTSAKLSAMGGGDLADDGPSTLLINPAPLGSGDSTEISYNHSDFFDGLELHTYAAAFELSGFRLSYAQQDYVGKDLLRRTAFNPEGNGETFDIRERMRLMGLSYNFGELIGKDSPLSWSIGADWRKSTGSYRDFSGEGDSLDLGTTLRWTTKYDQGWTRLTGVITRQNATNAKYVIDEVSLLLPRSHRFGLTIETALRKPGQTRDRFNFLMAYSRNAQIESVFRRTTDHYGVEAMFFGILAARYGHNNYVKDGVASWGVGVLLDQQLLGPLTIELDWGQMSYNHELLPENKTLWGMRAKYNF